MENIGAIERITQNRIISLFRNQLGYRYLGSWEKRDCNSNIEKELLVAFLKKRGYGDILINGALKKLEDTAGHQNKSLYDINKDVYTLLRYGVDVKPDAGKSKETVWLIDWQHPEKNDFAVAEEVTIKGIHSKRPDIVIYVNGIALGVLELKRSTVSVSEGIRQNLDNQKQIFIKPFFATVQYIMAGNDNEGIAYGTIETKGKYFLKWKEVSEELNKNDEYLLKITREIRKKSSGSAYLLDRRVIELLNKERFLELIHDYIVFDRGIKKLCRPNQYFGVKVAQDFIKRREGGIIWHTQGSGKSLSMVWLTKWIRENIPGARVLIITDREELDEQIEKVFRGVSEDICRTKSGRDLINRLNDVSPWLLCSLIFKFKGKDEGNIDEYLYELKNSLPADFRAKGDFYVFIDECHRTQSGKLHSAMKELLPDALLIGFTGTPILKSDKKISREIFGKYIHTYRFDEAVNDKVVLDLRYEARDIDQRIISHEGIDEWFESNTKGLTEYARTELKQKWGTLKKVFSSKSRLEKIVLDIMLDMLRKERLQNGRGNALLVSDSIYNACRFYELFQRAGLTRCAIVTSFVPNYADIKGEETGEGYTEKLQRYEIYKKMLSDYFNEDAEEALKKVEQFETEVKRKFVEEPAQMKLLIVVNKLLTGFDAPPATYLYIDKEMKDHGLFQAICRVNRLDGDDKDYGYIIDYKDLFGSLKTAFKDYTSGAFDAFDKEDVNGLLKDRLKNGKERLDEALEAIRTLYNEVEPPRDSLSCIRYFCGSNTAEPDALKNTEPRRISLYKLTIALIRAYTGIADEMPGAGYSEKEAEKIRNEVKNFEKLRKEVQIASGDYIDLKQYEPAMRFLIDSYIGADASRVLSNFDEMGLIDLLITKGVDVLNELPKDIRTNRDAVAETIENNLRRVIIEESPANPAYYEKMSVLLDELIRMRREEAKEYEEYLKEVVELSRKVRKPETSMEYPAALNTPAKRSLYDNLGRNEQLAIDIDAKIKSTRKDNWRDHKIKKREVEYAVKQVLLTHQVKEHDMDYVMNLINEQKEY